MTRTPDATRTAGPAYDETRPHPFVDPIHPNGGLINQCTSDAGPPRITIRNPIKRMRNGTRDGNVDWQATALDLAANLHATSIALEVSRELVDSKNTLLDVRRRAIESLKKLLETHRNYDAERCNKHYHLQKELRMVERRWWFRLFAPRSLKARI